MFCAIVDTNSFHKIASRYPPTEALEIFVVQLQRGNGKLYLGGYLRNEIPFKYKTWVSTALSRGWIRAVNDEAVEDLTEAVKANAYLQSDDPHIIALAQLSGARLLVSCDGELQDDFRNRAFLSNPVGKIFPVNAKSTAVHKFLNGGRFCTRSAL